MVEADEILVLDFAETLPKGRGVLAIGFEGVLNDKMKGFYRRYTHFKIMFTLLLKYIIKKKIIFFGSQNSEARGEKGNIYLIF